MPEDLKILDLDPHDDQMVEAWHGVYWTVEQHGRPETNTAWSLEQLRALMKEEARRQFNRGYVGCVGDRVVTMGIIGGSLLDNLTLCEVNVTTLPDERGQGHGTSMLAHL